MGSAVVAVKSEHVNPFGSEVRATPECSRSNLPRHRALLSRSGDLLQAQRQHLLPSTTSEYLCTVHLGVESKPHYCRTCSHSFHLRPPNLLPFFSTLDSLVVSSAPFPRKDYAS